MRCGCFLASPVPSVRCGVDDGAASVLTPTPAPRARETARPAATARDREPGPAPQSLTHPDPGGLPGEERTGERGDPGVGLQVLGHRVALSHAGPRLDRTRQVGHARSHATGAACVPSVISFGSYRLAPSPLNQGTVDLAGPVFTSQHGTGWPSALPRSTPIPVKPPLPSILRRPVGGMGETPGT